MKAWILSQKGLSTAVGLVGSAIASWFGGWTTSLTTLLIVMGIDYLTGLIVAGVFHKSPKTENGALESRAGWKGLCRKGMTLLIVLIACRLDLIAATMLGTGPHFVRDAVIIAYIVNEVISIIENAGLMGMPIPKVFTRAIEILKKRAEEELPAEMKEEKDHEENLS